MATNPIERLDLNPTDIELSREALHRNWTLLVVLGAVLMIGGALALITPVFATVAVEGVIGWAFLLGGLVQGLHALQARNWRPRLFHLVSAGIYVLASILILLNPIAGLIAITLVVIAGFFADGIVRIALGAAMRPEPGWLWVIGSGIVSVLMAVLLYTSWPGISFFGIGFYAAIALAFEGWAFIVVALRARREAREMEGFPEELEI